MLVINSKIPTKRLPIVKSLSELIQGFIYANLPNSEHKGFVHKGSGKNFKRMNFDFWLKDGNLRIRYTSFEPKHEEMIAMAILKNTLSLGEVHLIDTNVSVEQHRTQEKEIEVRGCIACAIKGLLGKKVYLEPQDSRHLEMAKTNALQRYETLTGKKYDDIFDMQLQWQSKNPLNFYYKHAHMKAWQGKWKINANPELTNVILDTGIGSGCMNAGVGFLEVVEARK